MKVLITGATGFLGTHLVSKFLRNGAEVIGIDKEDFYFQKELADKIELHKFDIREAASFARLFKNVDVVIHCAAALHDSPPKEIYSVNVGGTKSVLELCLLNQVPKFIFCSSTVVYGYFEHRPPVSEDSPLSPQHPYAASKVKGEEITVEYRSKGMNTCILRPKSFIGPARLCLSVGILRKFCNYRHS
jgi:nucleoside-diphosphate-sugar epimerase